jgi:hypothetical protein
VNAVARYRIRDEIDSINKLFLLLVCVARLELAAFRFQVGHSTRLSYTQLYVFVVRPALAARGGASWGHVVSQHLSQVTKPASENMVPSQGFGR